MVKDDMCENVAEVREVSDIVKTVDVFEEDVLRLILGYALQSGRKTVYDELKGEWDVYCAGDLVVCLGDTIWCKVGSHTDGLDWFGSWRVLYVDKETTLMVYTKSEGNPWGVSSSISGSRYRSEENKQCSQKICTEGRKISLLKDMKIRK